MLSKKILIGICAAVIVFGLVGIGYTIFSQRSSKFIGEPILKPWIEVVVPSVFVSNEDGSLKRELKTGDEIEAGAIVEVTKRGEANIYFPDGSVARLDEGTKISIDAASYDPKSKTLVVRVQLLIGRVWSKIFSLATPESMWEVKTSNAVATVRGTAFSMSSYPGKKEQLAVGRGAVNLQFFESGVPVGTKVVVEKDKMVNFTKNDVLSGVPITSLVEEQDELTRSEINKDLEKDKIFEIKQEGFSQNSSEFRNIIIEEHSNEPSVINQENSTSTSSEIFSEFKELRIIYDNNVPNKEIPIHSSVVFKALLVKNDLSERDVTSEVEWLVRTAQNVSIGTITKQGVFTARLDEDSSEQSGFGEGFITATWKDLSTGSVFRAQTQILKVFIPESAIPEDTTE